MTRGWCHKRPKKSACQAKTCQAHRPPWTCTFGLSTTTTPTATVFPMQTNTSPSPSTATVRHQRRTTPANTTTTPTRAWKERSPFGLKATTLQATRLTVAALGLTTTRSRTCPCRPRHRSFATSSSRIQRVTVSLTPTRCNGTVRGTKRCMQATPTTSFSRPAMTTVGETLTSSKSTSTKPATT